MNELEKIAGKVILGAVVFWFLCAVLSCCTPPEKIILRDIKKHAVQAHLSVGTIISIDTIGQYCSIYWKDEYNPVYYVTGFIKMPHPFKVGQKAIILR